MKPAACAAPGRDCPRCPRLVQFRAKNRGLYADKHNAPVPSFGAADPRLLVVGLAPGLKGANFSGRPFTGDYAGQLLYATLLKLGRARGAYDARPDDGLQLLDTRVTNAVRCVPPENRPTGDEITRCRPFLESELAGLGRLQVIVALGGIAHGSVLRALGLSPSAFKFRHAAVHALEPRKTLAQPVTLVDSYHCSRYNVNAGRLTAEMFEAALAAAVAELK